MALGLLPRDLLVLVVSFAPLRPRLLVVARVSRAFRRAVHLSLALLSSDASPVMRSLLHRPTRPHSAPCFPCLASLRLNGPFRAELINFARITALHVDYAPRNFAEFSTELTSLTVLSYRPACPSPLPLILVNASTLVSIALQGSAFADRLPQLGALPALRSLKIWDAPHCFECFAHLVPSLTRLSLDADTATIGLLCRLNAPHLLGLHIALGRSLSTGPLVDWVLTLPSLASLSLFTLFTPTTGDTWRLITLTTCITKLNVQAPLSFQSPADALGRHKGLRSLALPPGHLQAILQRVGGQLTDLTLRRVWQLANLVPIDSGLVSNLRTLRLAAHHLPLLRSWAFPHLSALVVRCGGAPMTALVETLSVALERCTTLRSLQLLWDSSAEEDEGQAGLSAHLDLSQLSASLRAFALPPRPHLTVAITKFPSSLRPLFIELAQAHPWVTLCLS